MRGQTARQKTKGDSSCRHPQDLEKNSLPCPTAEVGLAKALRFYRRGAVADRDREEQQRKASGLNLAIAAISLWNTVYLQKAIAALAKAGTPVPEQMIPHLSPLGWEHSTLTGSYYWRQFASDRNVLRPLRTRQLLPKRAQSA